jgi:hypothetical protein
MAFTPPAKAISASPDRLACQVHGDQRRGAGCVDGHARAAQVEGVGDTVGGDARRAAGVAVGVDDATILVAECRDRVIEAGDADVHRDRPAGETAGRRAGVLDRPQRHLQEHPLLRVHRGGLTGRDAEALRLEEVEIGDVPSPAGEDLAGPGPARHEELRRAPAVLGRVDDGVAAFLEQPPERPPVVGTARQPAADADDRQRLVGRGPA